MNTENGYVVYFSDIYHTSIYHTWVEVEVGDEIMTLAGFKGIDDDIPSLVHCICVD